jgi:hypothetical protein
MYDNVFSEFEVTRTGVLFSGGSTNESVGCTGSLEESLTTKTITKKCEGIEVKRLVKGAGNGNLTLSAHFKYEVFAKIYGMNVSNLKTGVRGYGKNSRHEAFTLTCLIKDEDGIEKLKAYPNVIANDPITRKIENGAEEITELTAAYYLMPDDLGNCMYEVVLSEIAEAQREAYKESWLTAWAQSLVTAAVTSYTVTFDPDNGDDDFTQTIQSGALAARPINPVKDGYIFSHWALGEDEYDIYTAITADITLIAQWTPST